MWAEIFHVTCCKILIMTTLFQEQHSVLAKSVVFSSSGCLYSEKVGIPVIFPRKRNLFQTIFYLLLLLQHSCNMS